jgi:hypothetical protein
MDLTTVSGVRAQLEAQPLWIAGWQKGRSLEGADSAYRGVWNYHIIYLYHIFYRSSRNNVQKGTNTAERTQELRSQNSGVRQVMGAKNSASLRADQCPVFFVFAAAGSWLLAPGSWLLAPGSWLLAPGSWLLAPGS